MPSPGSFELEVAAEDSRAGDALLRPLQIRAGSDRYPVLAGPGVVRRLPEVLADARLEGRPRIIADRRVWTHHGARVGAALTAAGRPASIILVDSGEESKSLASAEALYDQLIEMGTTRADPILAIGGGVVGDLAGFVAATFLRGLPLVHVPTTLLAQVDSSIGGKVAVNHRLGKNLIGAFHQPAAVIADTDLLASLPDREYRSGWAEIVKVAMITDGDLFRSLQTHAEKLLAQGDPDLLGVVVRRAIELKGDVVGEDERENGRRVILNYGHTIGHALEAATHYRRFLHGEAVAIGMAGAGLIARKRGLLDDSGLGDQADLLRRFGLPARADGVATAALRGPLSRDKKVRGTSIQWVLPTGIGSVTTARDVAAGEVDAALRAVGCV